jgi:dTDP-4-dehydrorhamnose reductase
MSENRRIAVLGSTGQLGSELVNALRMDNKFETLALAHSDCDCRKGPQVTNAIRNFHPDVVINCAAYVRVDDCEDHAHEAFEVNTVGALNVARACAQFSALCVYISTDYVFNGAKDGPYVESDATCPINVYGVSKLAGEYLVKQTASRWLVVRMASLFGKTGARGKGGNFVETVINKAKTGEALRVVNDIIMSPTYARDASKALVSLLQEGTGGVFHLTNSGACTWYEFAKMILDFTGIVAAVVPISSDEFPTRARRPANSALRSMYSACDLCPWQDGLLAYLKEKGHI